MRKIFVSLFMIASLCFAAPASAGSPNCITLGEFKAVHVSNGTLARDGTHRQRVINIFDVRPAPRSTFNPPGPKYDLADFYNQNVSCNGDIVYHMYYDRIEHSAGHVHFHLDVKCAADGKKRGGINDRCVRG